MKHKKIIWSIGVGGLLIGLLVTYIFRPMTMNDVYQEPNFTGVVTEVYEQSLLVTVNEGEEALRSSDKIVVSLDVQLKDSITTFRVGQTVKVFYDGAILETYPARVGKVYAILLVSE